MDGENTGGYVLRVRLKDDLRQALSDAAQRQDRSLSGLCRLLLREGVARLNAEAAERTGHAGYPVSDAASAHHQQHSQGRH